jgi:hypothetical protein
MKHIKALQLLQKSDSQSVDGEGDIDSIEIDAGIEKPSFDKNAIAVSLYADNENYKFEYHFTKQNLMDAKIKKNKITLLDADDNEVSIFCYQSVPCEL